MEDLSSRETLCNDNIGLSADVKTLTSVTTDTWQVHVLKPHDNDDLLTTLCVLVVPGLGPHSPHTGMKFGLHYIENIIKLVGNT